MLQSLLNLPYEITLELTAKNIYLADTYSCSVLQSLLKIVVLCCTRDSNAYNVLQWLLNLPFEITLELPAITHSLL